MKAGAFSLMQWPESRSQEDVYRNELAQLIEGEELGFDSAWFGEHHFSRYGINPSIHLTLAYLAAATKRIRIGSSIVIAPLYKPLRLVEEAAQLDLMSGGRFEWGLGRGYQGHEFKAFETDIAQTRDMVDDLLGLIDAAWSVGPDEPVSYNGRYTHIDNVKVEPHPLQSPLPVAVAAVTPVSVQWVAEKGLAFMADQFQGADRLVAAHREWDAAMLAAGHDPRAVSTKALRQVFVADSEEEAREIAKPALLWYFRSVAAVANPAGSKAGERGGELPDSYAQWASMLEGLAFVESDPEAFCEQLFETSAICGPPEYVLERLKVLADAGYDEVISWHNYGSMSHENARSSMKRFAADVLPELARMERGAPAPQVAA